MDDLPPQTRRLWDQLSTYIAEKAAETAVEVGRVAFNRREIQAALDWSYGQLRIHLDRLVEQEYVVATGGGFGQVVSYRVAPFAPTPTGKPTPMTLGLQGLEGGLQGFAAPTPTNENDSKSSDKTQKIVSLQGCGVCTTGGMQPDASYVGTEAPPVVVFGLDTLPGQAAG